MSDKCRGNRRLGKFNSIVLLILMCTCPRIRWQRSVLGASAAAVLIRDTSAKRFDCDACLPPPMLTNMFVARVRRHGDTPMWLSVAGARLGQFALRVA